MSAQQDISPPDAVLEAYELVRESLARAASGLINPTWFVRSRRGAALVLQRVSPLFTAEVNIDIAAVTEHLARKGMLTPRLVPTRAGALWLRNWDLSFVDGAWSNYTETSAAPD